METKINIIESLQLYILLMIFIEVGAIISSITFNLKIFIFNSVISIIVFVFFIVYSFKKRELKPKK